MYLQALFLLLLCSFDAGLGSQPQRHPRASDQCQNFVDGPFGFCSKGGYNTTFNFPDILTDSMLEGVARSFRRILNSMENCSRNGLAHTMTCSFVLPYCSGARKRVYPCKRVCGEFLKQCVHKLPARFLDIIIGNCHVLPDELATSGKCFEPPNFKTNDTIKGPLDRGCQELIIPACKNLGVSNYTLIGADLQHDWYFHSYHKRYSPDDAETEFPPDFQKVFKKHPKCQNDLKKMFCGEFFPPCFPDDGQGLYSICKPVCEGIARDCPGFFRDDSPWLAAEFCSLLGKENTSHGYCKRVEWPPPFSWVRFYQGAERPTDVVPAKGPAGKGTKVWVIVVAVLVALILVGLILLGAICFKLRRRAPGAGYKKQEDDMAPLEMSVDL